MTTRLIALALSFLMAFGNAATPAAPTVTQEAVASSKTELHLSATELKFRAGDTLRLTVEPTASAQPLGWTIGDVAVSSTALRPLSNDSPEAQAKREELQKSQNIAGNPDDGRLVIYLYATRAGFAKINVSLQNVYYPSEKVDVSISASVSGTTSSWPWQDPGTGQRPSGPSVKPDNPGNDDPCKDGRHHYGDWIIDTAATANTDGSKHRVCTECNDRQEEVIPATGGGQTDPCTNHNFVNGLCTNPGCDATCDESSCPDNVTHTPGTQCPTCGVTPDAPQPEHNPVASAHTKDDFDANGKCTHEGCIYTRDDFQKDCTAGHSGLTTANNCPNCGIAGTLCTNHTGHDALHDGQECEICYQYTGTAPHVYGEWEEVTAPTADSAGEKKRTCSCGHVETAVVPATPCSSYLRHDDLHDGQSCPDCDVVGTAPHTFGEWEVDEPATAEAAGSKHRNCTGCSHVETEEIPKLNTFDSSVYKPDDNLTFTYNGEEQGPVWDFNGLPEGVTTRIQYLDSKGSVVSTPTHAGTYDYVVYFENVPPTYAQISNVEGKFTIEPKPITLSHELGEDGKVNVELEGLVPGDVVDSTTTVSGTIDPTNGSTTTDKTVDVTANDFSVVTTKVQLAGVGDYTIADSDKTTIYQTVASENWFKVEMRLVDNGNTDSDTVTVQFVLKDTRTDQFQTYTNDQGDKSNMFAVELHLNYDTDVIRRDSSTQTANGEWSVIVPTPSGEVEVDEPNNREKTISAVHMKGYYDGTETETTLCTVTFKFVDDENKSDILLSVDSVMSEVKPSEGDDGLLDFEYKTTSSIIVINPYQIDPEIVEVKVDGDLNANAEYTGGGTEKDEADARAELDKLIKGDDGKEDSGLNDHPDIGEGEVEFSLEPVTTDDEATDLADTDSQEPAADGEPTLVEQTDDTDDTDDAAAESDAAPADVEAPAVEPETPAAPVVITPDLGAGHDEADTLLYVEAA